MLRRIGGVAGLIHWQAWYEAEPRGEDRADRLIAYLASVLPLGVNSWKYHQQSLHDTWTPLTDDEKRRRKRARQMGLKKKMAQYGEGFKAVKAAKEKKRSGK